MARIKEFFPIVQVGIRSMDASEKEAIERGKIFYAEHIHDQSDWQSEVLRQLNDNVYITIDLDVFDPSLMPSTGTPEPGGLGWYPVLKLLKEVCQQKNIIGFDVTELCPNVYKASNFLAAKLIYKLISYHAAYGKQKK
jgi:agmatinase